MSDDRQFITVVFQYDEPFWYCNVYQQGTGLPVVGDGWSRWKLWALVKAYRKHARKAV